MATIDHYADNAIQQKPRQRRRIDWQIQLISGLAAACLLLAMALIYRAHQALADLVPAHFVPAATGQELAPSQPPARTYKADDDVWPWLEPLPPTF